MSRCVQTFDWYCVVRCLSSHLSVKFLILSHDLPCQLSHSPHTSPSGLPLCSPTTAAASSVTRPAPGSGTHPPGNYPPPAW